MRAASLGWLGEQDLDEKRRLRKALYTSLGVHVLLFAALVISPQTVGPIPDVITVEMIGAPPIAAPPAPAKAKSKGSPKPPPPAAKPKPPEPAAEPPPEPAPPVPKAPVKVLPENEPKPDKVKQAPKEKPKEVAKAEPKPRPAEKPAEEPAESDDELSYEDAMKSLDDELGPDETSDLLEAPPDRPSSSSSSNSSGQARSQAGVRLDPALAAWYQATLRRIQSRWVTPAAFRDRGLATVMSLRLSASGEVMGEPEVTRSSGDPYFDDNAVRAVLSASPLPPPPRAGETQFIFRSEEN